MYKLHSASEEASILDENQWHRANPGLKCGIKSLDAMRFAAQSAAATPSDIAYFKSHELNLRLRPDQQVLVTVDDWMKVEQDAPLDTTGPCYLGIDLGAVSSMSAVAAFFPDTGALLGFGCFPAIPDLVARGQKDGVGNLYVELVNEGSIRQFGDRIPDYRAFLEWVLDELGNIQIEAVAYDRFQETGNGIPAR